EDAQDGDWHAALRAGAEEYADLLLRPWWQQPGVLIGSVLAGVSSLVAALSLLVMRTAARRRVDRALPRLEDVHAQRALTDAAARGLPTDSPYAQAVLRDHEVYAAELAEAERLRAELPAPGRRGGRPRGRGGGGAGARARRPRRAARRPRARRPPRPAAARPTAPRPPRGRRRGAGRGGGGREGARRGVAGREAPAAATPIAS